jgi:hypothetical protein
MHTLGVETCRCTRRRNTMSERRQDSIGEYLALVERVQDLHILLEGGEDVCRYYNEAIDELRAYKAEQGISNDRVTLYHRKGFNKCPT